MIWTVLNDPLFILVLGVAIVVGMIVVFRVNAFLSLLAAALVVSFWIPTEGANWEEKILRVSLAFGNMTGKVGILIAMGAIIGKCMLDSGSADRIIRTICRWFGEKMVPAALLTSGYVLSIPVFYETTFYLLVPVARSMYRATKKNYILYLTAIGFGATISHTLIPPTPGPVAVAETLQVSIGSMMLVSLLIGTCTAPFALGIAYFANWLLPHPTVHFKDEEIRNEEHRPVLDESENLPSFWWAITPIVLPVLLISIQTTLLTLEHSKVLVWPENLLFCQNLFRLLGDPRMALILAAVLSMGILFFSRRLTFQELDDRIEAALISGGLVILIVAAGGSFGAMLGEADVGGRIKELLQSEEGLNGSLLLVLGFAVASLIKTAQGSSTAAMITTAGIFHGILSGPEAPAVSLPYHTAYLAVCIGLGSCVTGWMNDGGFWLFCRMGGIKETDALKTWTVGLALLGLSGLMIALIFSRILPLV